MKTYHLEGEYIELAKLLKLMKLAVTGGHAKIIIENGEILRNGKHETRKRAKIQRGDQLLVNDIQITIT